MAEAGEEFCFDAALEGVVDALVDGGKDPMISNANFTDLSDFEGLEVGDSKPGEEAFFVEGVDFAEGVFEWVLAVRAVEVEHVDFGGLEGGEGVEETAAHVGWSVGVGVVGVHGGAGVGVKFGVHDCDAALSVVELGEELFAGAVAIDAGGVDLIVAVGDKGVDELAGFFSVVDSSSEGI